MAGPEQNFFLLLVYCVVSEKNKLFKLFRHKFKPNYTIKYTTLYTYSVQYYVAQTFEYKA
jgi:hypothetical protein